MKFHGFQKLTLLDFPGKTAATLFTGGCNFRCPFCHNALLVTDVSAKDAIYDEEYILDFLKKREGLLDGVAVTGGEPLMHREILEFIPKIRELGFAVKIDTNGSYPHILREILQRKLADYVAMDIKNSFEKYALTAGVENLDTAPIKESMDLLMNGDCDFEFRTTVTREFHENEDIEKIAKEISGNTKYFLQNFVDSGNLICSETHGRTEEEMKEMLEIARKYAPLTEIRGL